MPPNRSRRAVTPRVDTRGMGTNSSGSYCFIVVTKSEARSGRPAGMILEARAALGQWPLNTNTRNRRRIRPGSKLLFYAAGNPAHDPIARCFWGEGVAETAMETSRVVIAGSREWLGSAWPTRLSFRFSVTERYSPAVPIGPLLDQLGLIRNRASWGVHLIGGIARAPLAGQAEPQYPNRFGRKSTTSGTSAMTTVSANMSAR
jgi:hypothetical protein